MLRFNGKAICYNFSPFIGIVTFNNRSLTNRANYIYVTDSKPSFRLIGYRGIISSKEFKDKFYLPEGIFLENATQFFCEGDIVKIYPDGRVHILWEINSYHNVLFLTESCNCKCLMCPQPPQKHDPQLPKDALNVLDLLKGKKIENICISGGEPTLVKDEFKTILLRCLSEHPEAQTEILTNGKSFADSKFADEVAAISEDKAVFCVSLHSDIDEIHDQIVGRKGSYKKTLEGIYNLAANNCSIEIRIVVNKYNYNSLERMAEHLYNYLPFCVHYVFMGMEVQGYARNNFDEINAYPHEYRSQLSNAVLSMARKGLSVSVYNIPLCMCDRKIWPYAKQSISTWKNTFMKECASCKVKNNCAGFFENSSQIGVKFIKPFLHEL